MPLVDLTFAMNYSSRRHQSLFGVFQNIATIEELKSISKEAVATIEKIVKDILHYLEISRTQTTGRLLYRFLIDSGYINRLVKNPSLQNEDKIKNIAKFFDMVRNFEIVAKEDRVIYFVNYLDMLIQAGDDPATVEADLDIPAINVLTIHRAKGLEFEVVFLVSLVMGKFPWPHRHETLELPDELIKDILPAGDFHIQEERRLFYVGMTRAKKEL
jgi:DNA helicase-2/ATP-dependent DNA helicase PcrA